MGQDSGFAYRVDIIRTVAIISVLLLHAQNDLTIQQMTPFEPVRWVTVDVYQSLGRLGVPLFLMLTGMLLLQPSQYNEPLKVFFKKRWHRIGLPVIFWGIIYFAWDFLVEQKAVTSNAIIQGVLTGPYYQFWYIYLLIGLYLLTPPLRILMAHANASLIKYVLIVWLVGAALLPVAGLFTSFYLDSGVFTFTGFAGYFILGAYLATMKTRRITLIILSSIGAALTAISTYVIAATAGGVQMFYFQQYLSPTILLASAPLFLLLNTSQAPQTPNQINKTATGNPSIWRRLLSAISENTLPIFLLHVIVIAVLQRGYLGLAINGNTINSVIGVPLMTAATLFICLAIIVPLKKVPGLKKLIG